MPLTIPVLDDRRFDDLVAEARAMIPTHAPEWTDHNASDPGITLLELFAHITEMLMYRLDRTTPDQICAFLNLLDSSRVRTPGDTPDLPAEVRATILQLRAIDRAVTADDYELLARACPDGANIARVRCLPGRNFENPADERADDVSVVVLPVAAIAIDADASSALRDCVKTWIDDRRLLGTRLHVVEPVYVNIRVAVVVVPGSDQRDAGAVVETVAGTVERYFSEYYGGADGRGWPFGRAVYVSDLVALVSRLPQVSHVYSVSLTAGDRDAVTYTDKDGFSDKNRVGVPLGPNELVRPFLSVSVLS